MYCFLGIESKPQTWINTPLWVSRTLAGGFKWRCPVDSGHGVYRLLMVQAYMGYKVPFFNRGGGRYDRHTFDLNPDLQIDVKNSTSGILNINNLNDLPAILITVNCNPEAFACLEKPSAIRFDTCELEHIIGSFKIKIDSVYIGVFRALEIYSLSTTNKDPTCIDINIFLFLYICGHCR